MYLENNILKPSRKSSKDTHQNSMFLGLTTTIYTYKTFDCKISYFLVCRKGKGNSGV